MKTIVMFWKNALVESYGVFSTFCLKNICNAFEFNELIATIYYFNTGLREVLDMPFIYVNVLLGMFYRNYNFWQCLDDIKLKLHLT